MSLPTGEMEMLWYQIRYFGKAHGPRQIYVRTQSLDAAQAVASDHRPNDQIVEITTVGFWRSQLLRLVAGTSTTVLVSADTHLV